MPEQPYPRIATFHTALELANHLKRLGWDLPVDEAILCAPASPLAAPIVVPWLKGERRVGNRFAVQPMEGWDAQPDGAPSDLTRRRWMRFAVSGAKLLWGCEAVAVLPEARANPRQLLLNERTAPALAELRRQMIEAHRERFGETGDLIIGLQLTHSGRFCRPREEARLEPIIAYHHPILDIKYPACVNVPAVSDEELIRIVGAFGRAARLAQESGFDFVDLKHCHGYLGHELLGAYHRAGPYGGSFDNRTRFLRGLVDAVRSSAPGLEIGVRLSAYDSVPFVPDAQTKRGVPASTPGQQPYTWGFGVDAQNPVRSDLGEARRVLTLLSSLNVHLVNISAGSPYYSPHLQRPALFPPCDAYLPPEDPLQGAVRMWAAAAELKASVPELVFVSSGGTYLQDYLPHFAQAVVRAGWTDFVGLGRMMLPYPEFPADVLEKGRLDRKKICRTFSDCTNGPRQGLVSGCYPLDPFYKGRPEAKELQAKKAQLAKPPAAGGQTPQPPRPAARKAEERIAAAAGAQPVALITGASRGIGRGIAIELARLGFCVAINYVQSHESAIEAAALCEQAALESTPAAPKNSVSPRFGVFRADISNASDRAGLLQAVQERFGWVDLLVNNAGVAPQARLDLLQAGEESFDRLMNTNVRGPYFLTQALANIWIRGLGARPQKSRRPKIVNISSVSAYAPSVNRGDYCMSKAALSMMTQLFATRLAEYGINVYEIRPGIVLTDMTGPVKEKYDAMIAGGLMPLARWGTPEDVGRAVAAIAEGRLPYSTGEVINVDGGFHVRRL
jgi:NAD(P)-dependent dehydrogenase (short-subunit alcohol dehydrogenase family)/2,4-dienoyl-CoA reductase-like NADH-dependent reductase (Old Yellow Enzyme family)